MESSEAQGNEKQHLGEGLTTPSSMLGSTDLYVST